MGFVCGAQGPHLYQDGGVRPVLARQGEPRLSLRGHWDPLKKCALSVPRSRATPRRASGPPMRGVGRTKGLHRYRGGAGSGRPSAGVSLGYILGGGGSLHLVPQTRAAEHRGGPLVVGTGLTLALHRCRGGVPQGGLRGAITPSGEKADYALFSPKKTDYAFFVAIAPFQKSANPRFFLKKGGGFRDFMLKGAQFRPFS